MGDYYFLDVSLELENPDLIGSVSAIFFKSHVQDALKTLFGEVAVSQPVDLLKYNEENRRGVLRCPASNFVKLRSSLTLCGSLLGTRSAFRVHNTSPSLLSLLGNSRTYSHSAAS